MMHYPLFPHTIASGHVFFPSKKEDTEETGYEIVRNRLADVGIEVIFTGHNHINDIAKDWNADFTRTIYDVTTGSISQYPFYYRIVTLSQNLNKMEIVSSNVTQVSDSFTGETFSIEAAKARYISESLLQSRINTLISSGLSEVTSSIAAPYMNKASIFHAEGDEKKNPFAQELLIDMISLQISSPYFLDYTNGVLLDISNYGNAERENQTDDNNLIINLNGNDTSILKVENDNDGGHEFYYTVEGHRLLDKPKRTGVYITKGRKIVIR